MAFISLLFRWGDTELRRYDRGLNSLAEAGVSTDAAVLHTPWTAVLKCQEVWDFYSLEVLKAECTRQVSQAYVAPI
jgi:hypothetical protein